MIGILGGMGTQAGLDFCNKLAILYRGKIDQEYPLFLLFNKSNIPGRPESIGVQTKNLSNRKKDKKIEENVVEEKDDATTEDLDKIQIKDIGPKIESNSLFPEKVNVTFAKKINDKHFKVLHWERGAGLTKACGTAACATAIAGEINKVSIYPTEIEFKLGKIKINKDVDGNILMEGNVSNIEKIHLNL